MRRNITHFHEDPILLAVNLKDSGSVSIVKFCGEILASLLQNNIAEARYVKSRMVFVPLFGLALIGRFFRVP